MDLIAASPKQASHFDRTARPAPSASSFRSDSANLDLLRAVAVMCVFFSHLYEIWAGGRPLVLWHFAQMGVSIFFVHTAMVLMLSLERLKLDGVRRFAAFYLRRIFRLYPFSMFCVTLAMAFGLSPVIRVPVRHWGWPEYLANLTLTTNLTYSSNMVGGLWTLPIEVQMYFLLPFLFLLGRARSTSALFWLWVFALPLAILQLHTSARLNVLGFGPCFLAGVIAWKLSTWARRRLPGALWPVAFVLTWPVFFLATHQDDMYFRWLFCLTLGLVIPWFREVRFRPLNIAARHIARYSYGIYLSHVAIFLWTLALPLPRAQRVLILVLLSTAVPVAVFHLIEQPMIAVGQKLSRLLFEPKPAEDRSFPDPASLPGLAISTAKL